MRPRHRPRSQAGSFSLPTVAPFLLAVVTTITTAPPLEAQISTDFDDLSQGGVPDGYAGFDWTNFLALAGATQEGGYPAATVSAPNVVYNGMGNDASFESLGGPFTFTSAWFTAAWENGLTLNVAGYQGASVIFTDALILDTSGPLLGVFQWENVDRVEFSTVAGVQDPKFVGLGSGKQFVMDNLLINGEVVGVVPEPGTVLLMSTGLLGLAAVVGRRRRGRDNG